VADIDAVTAEGGVLMVTDAVVALLLPQALVAVSE
jgi:hypothetical protein